MTEAMNPGRVLESPSIPRTHAQGAQGHVLLLGRAQTPQHTIRALHDASDVTKLTMVCEPPMLNPPSSPKFTLLNNGPHNLQRRDIGYEDVDTLYIDLWDMAELPARKSLDLVIDRYREFRPRHTVFWTGMEIDIATDLFGSGADIEDIAKMQSLDAFRIHNNLIAGHRCPAFMLSVMDTFSEWSAACRAQKEKERV